MSNEVIIPKNLNKWTTIQKGEWLEEETKVQLEKLGFNTTITKSYSWTKDKNALKRKFKILGDNGIDGYARRKIESEEYKCIIQCKCYGKKTQISTDVIAHIESNIAHLESRNTFGLLVMLHEESMNNRAWNAIRNAKYPIIVTEISRIHEIVDQLKSINWMDYPTTFEKRKRTKISFKEAQEISSTGSITIKGKEIKEFMYNEDLIEY